MRKLTIEYVTCVDKIMVRINLGDDSDPNVYLSFATWADRIEFGEKAEPTLTVKQDTATVITPTRIVG